MAVDDLGVLREAARDALYRNCGECHTSTLPTALPRALRVYDLAQLDWSHRMSDAQLAMFHRYVELEVQRRAAAR